VCVWSGGGVEERGGDHARLPPTAVYDIN
jgi:hypothetical protein